MATSTEQLKYADLEQQYVNKGYVLTFFHIASGKSVSFKGRITQFSDKFDSEWTDEQVYGRSDPISNFKGTKRQISLSWTIVAASLEEAISNQSKVSLLFNMLYPTYNPVNGQASAIGTSPLLKVSFANLIQNVQGGPTSGLVCKLNGLSYDPEMDEEFFDPEPNILYPQTIKMSTTLTIFHTHALGWGPDKQVRTGKFPYGTSIKQPEDLKNVGSKANENVSQNSTVNGSKNHKEAMQSSVLNSVFGPEKNRIPK